jgi:release factor glutamine methyltransferase
VTIREAKRLGLKKLKRSSKNEAAIDAEILLTHVLGISREELLTHDERPVPSFLQRRFNRLLARRARHEPIAYLTGHKEFFGLQFAVNKHTLIPRPETELLVEEALNTLHATRYTLVIDIGTGSGTIAVTIAKNAPATTVIATDLSKQALKIAELNAKTNDVDDRIFFEHANLLPKAGALNLNNCVITANLPYLPTKVWQKCPPDVKKFEPKTALEGGHDGLKYYDELFHQIVERNIKAPIICEIDSSQKKSFLKLAMRYFPDATVEIKNDLAGLARIATISIPPTKQKK